MLLNRYGNFDARNWGSGNAPPGWAIVYDQPGLAAGAAARLCSALRLEFAEVMVGFSPEIRGGYSPEFAGVLVPEAEANRVGRACGLLVTGALRLERDASNRFDRLAATSPRLRIEIVELPADAEAEALAALTPSETKRGG